MSEYQFPASTQIAIEWVCTTLINQPKQSSWRHPVWTNFVWFTRIVAEDICTIDDLSIIAHLVREEDEEVVKRDIVFYLGRDEVVRVSMLGIRRQAGSQPFIGWTVSDIAYRLSWPDASGGWKSHSFVASTFRGLPSAVAPVG